MVLDGFLSPVDREIVWRLFLTYCYEQIPPQLVEYRIQVERLFESAGPPWLELPTLSLSNLELLLVGPGYLELLLVGKRRTFQTPNPFLLCNHCLLLKIRTSQNIDKPEVENIRTLKKSGGS